MAGSIADIITPFEAEGYVESLECIDLTEVGSQKWMTLHERLESLNMQMLVEAQAQKEEHVKDLIISRDKLSFLVKELILTQVWREKIFTQILKQEEKPKTSIGIYMVLHHEVTVLSLLEMTCFRVRSSVTSDSALEQLGDLVLDLIDYCHGTVVHLLAHPGIRLEPPTAAEEASIEQTLQRQRDGLRFMAAVQCISLLQYIAEELPQLTVSAASRLMRQHDLPLTLIQLLDDKPWVRENSAGKRQKYDNRSWVASPRDDFSVAKVEGQVWLTLVFLLMSRELMSLYEISEYRRNQLLRLQTHLTDALLDQIPPLAPLRQWLAHLCMGQAPPTKPCCIIETIPEVRQQLLAQCEGRWAAVARQQLEQHFRTDMAAVQEQARRLAAVYDLDKMAPLMTEETKCGACGEPAGKKCSRCKAVWYCGRQCQVKHWPTHKAHCDTS